MLIVNRTRKFSFWCDWPTATLRDEAFRQSRRYANAKRGQRPQLPLKAISPTGIAAFSTLLLN
ncbi:hypothetical protein [Moorena sp. SIO4A5]|uniref:hypothetical protein n=1 Tax=Moorena sp. SIO4A5 TaxID=2607838 RepID=UPI0013C96256|nr:hypothetical protein [Moorena sp. SIO4A5]NEO25203.1 hypothetical protein [Moorena sp. SIO4A5]